MTVPESAWFKSSYSSGEGGECVEVAAASEAVLVRDSKQPTAAKIAFGPRAWGSFVRMAVER
ncbi:DUF397 domain-containing protein [Streptomyces sp. NPDC046831]|uniref:DUF397 domain-containing protein n=1 Tax=Streptomyces sp. NPDC046831 TaxID=3154805 RepID=UPI0033F5035C